MKAIGIAALLIGLGCSLFAAVAYWEIVRNPVSEPVQGAARYYPGRTPKADEMPLTSIIVPDMFDPEYAEIPSSEFESIALDRIYKIGIGSMVLALLGIVLLVWARNRNRNSLLTNESQNAKTALE